MLPANHFLKKCEKLSRLGFTPTFELGMTVARGFADLGYEVFSMIGPNKMVSLFTGQVAELLESHRHFFFAVLDIDTMLSEISRLGYDLETLSYVDQRLWIIKATNVPTSRSIELDNIELGDLLVETLICIKGSNV